MSLTPAQIDAKLQEAVSEVQATTDSYPTWVKKGRPSTHWTAFFSKMNEVRAGLKALHFGDGHFGDSDFGG